MKLLNVLQRSTTPPTLEQRYSVDDYMQMVYNGHNYIVGASGSKPDEVDNGFVSYVQRVHNRHGVVAAAVVTRALLMSQVRFKWRRIDGSLYGNRDLLPLERPGSYTRPELLSRLEHDVSYSGTGLVGRRGDELFRLAPDRTSFVIRSESDPTWDGDTLMPPFDAKVVGLVYNPGQSKGVQGRIEVFTVGEFAVWAPNPDPVYFWRGTSWITSVMREVLIDGQVTDHEGQFFEKAAVPGLVFMMDPSRTPDEIKAYSDVVNRKFAGNTNSYKNMFLGGATDVKVVGSSMADLGLSELQGTFKNRVAVRSRIPAVVLGTKESLSGSSLNAGNYSAARRMLADGWFTPTVDGLCAALEALLPVPSDGSELGFDPSRVLFLQEDQKDAADILSTNAAAMRQLVDGGFDPDSVVAAITTGDMNKLAHSGNVSVQLQPAGTIGDATGTVAVDDGKSNARELAEIVQKIYLGVGKVLTADEARKIINDAGGKLPAGFAPSSTNSADLIADVRSAVIADAVRTPQPINVNVDARQDAPIVNVPEQRFDAPHVTVTVDPTPVTIDNTINVDPTPVTIENNNRVDVAPAKVPPAQVTIMPADDDGPSVYKVRRDRDGRISEVVED